LYIAVLYTWCEMDRGWGVFSSTGIGCAKPRVDGNLGLLVLFFGGGGRWIYLTMLDFKIDF
jgi:hypothetical protein